MKDKTIKLLKEEGFSHGLIQALNEIHNDCAIQIWLIDNSESMKKDDGHLLATNGKGFANCTRWEELCKVMRSHIQLAGALRVPSSFRFMNKPTDTQYSNLPQRFDICLPKKDGSEISDDDVVMQVQNGLEILGKSRPHGLTPLNDQFVHVAEEVKGMIDHGKLKASGKKVAIIIATDGGSTDIREEFFLDRAKKLAAAPDQAPHVHLAIRLCTDEPAKVDFFNKVDKETGDNLSMDVLVDFQAEAIEICKVNPWLNYCIPLQRMREMGGGFNTKDSRVLDLLDEAPLSKQDTKEMCILIFGKDKMQMCPEPEFDWDGFVAHIQALQQDTDLHWDPIEEEMKPWVDFVEDHHKDKLSKRRKLKHKKQLRWFTGGILDPILGS